MKKFILPILLFLMFIPVFVDAKTCDNDKISIKNIEIKSMSNNVEELSKATASGKNINVNLSMSEVGDFIKYIIVVENGSNDDYVLDKKSFKVNSNYIKYNIESEDNSNLIKSNSSKKIYLKINYENEVPEKAFKNGAFNDNKSLTVNLSTNNILSILKNPKTGFQFYCIWLLIIVLVSITLYIMLRNKQYTKFMVFILGITIIIPISAYALCKSNISITSNVKIKKESKVPKSFSSDSWDVIAYNVKNHNDSCYHVGDTKEVDLGEFGVHNVRVINTSSPLECSNDNFSQTACGFVIEFEDIIIKKKMNEERINDNGWCASDLRNSINNDIYNALPTDLKNVITETKVISGYLDGGTALTCNTNDKLFLLSSKELNGTVPTFGNAANYVEYGVDILNTRQLDYYENNSKIKQFNGNADNWWVRSVVKKVVPDNRYFSEVISNGKFYGVFANDDIGVSPAFKIG